LLLTVALRFTTPQAFGYGRSTAESSGSGLDKLEGLLSAQKWQEADEQTKKIVLKDNQGNPLTAPKIRELTPELLDSIDRLWMGYSDGKFGLKIQRQLWQKIM
jgi:hypothetical protein